MTVFIIAHSAPIVKGFSVPLTLIIIPLFQKKSRGNVAQNESKIFVQIAGTPGRNGYKSVIFFS